jgi:thiaminase/transcriptional activator TenA
MKQFNIPYPNEIALSTEAYANFLLSATAYKSYQEAIAGLLPCFWLYNKVAAAIYENASPGNKYQKWIDTYSGAEFDQTTQRLKNITENLAVGSNDQTKERMMALFVRSALYEWYFWDSAYYLRFWKTK